MEPLELTLHTYPCFANLVENCACDSKISSDMYTKYLGVYIDKNLRYGMHIDYLTKKIRINYVSLCLVSDAQEMLKDLKQAAAKVGLYLY